MGWKERRKKDWDFMFGIKTKNEYIFLFFVYGNLPIKKVHGGDNLFSLGPYILYALKKRLFFLIMKKYMLKKE